MIVRKKCHACGRMKDAAKQFRLSDKTKDGYTYKCNMCRRKYMIAYTGKDIKPRTPAKKKSVVKKISTPPPPKLVGTERPQYEPVKQSLIASKEDTLLLLTESIKTLSERDQQCIQFLLNDRIQPRGTTKRFRQKYSLKGDELLLATQDALIRLKDELRRRGIQSFRDLPFGNTSLE